MLNVVICGTPGTGKSSLIEKLKDHLEGFKFINLGKFAIAEGCIEGYDEELETQIIDEEKLTTKLVPVLKENKLNIVECIHGDMLSRDLVKLVCVCRADTEKLYDRLQARGYKQEKITHNVESEIFQTILEDAVETFGSDLVIQLTNNEPEDLDNNVHIVLDRINCINKSASP